MERVIVESPYKGNIPINELYGEFCLNDCIVNHNESPFASHLLYTRDFVLDDSKPAERQLGIKAGFVWRKVAERTVFYCDLGMTSGMKQGMRDIKDNMRYDIRWLPDDRWKIFSSVCKIKGFGVPEREEKV